MMWNTSSIHPLLFACSQNWLFSDTFRGFAPLVSMSCWRSSIASRWNKWIDVPGCVALLRWTKIQTLWFDHALARWLYQVLLHPNKRGSGSTKISKMCSFIFCIFCDVIRDADLIGGIREWLSFLFTCENQLMLALLKEKHFQALGRCTLQWLGQFMRTRCNLESQSLPLSCTTLTQAFIIPSIPLMQVTFSRCFHGMPIHISLSSRPSTTLHIGWVPSRKGSLMLRIWNENAKPWKASLRNSDAWRSVDRIFFRWIQMWNTLGNFVQKYVLIFDYLFVVWALISPCVALLILFVVCKRISVERLWVTY